jgi:chromosomal replication initiator protein
MPETTKPDHGPAESTRDTRSASQQAGTLDEPWARVLELIARRVRASQFETWFQRAVAVELDDARLVIAVNNRFTRDWLLKNYFEQLEESVESVFGRKLEVELIIDPERAAALPATETTGEPEPDAPHPEPRPAQWQPNGARPSNGASAAPASKPSNGHGLDAGSDIVLHPNYRFDTYVVGPCNRFAHAACAGVAENPSAHHNPLFLHGNVGLGKTHLLQAICHTMLERDLRPRILYLSCETFVNHFISALEDGDLGTFRTKYRNVDVLVVDDIHMLANKERTQEEFFHTFNTLYNAGSQIILSSDSPPVEIPSLQERLVSRFKWGLVTEMEKPCYETRVALLKRKSRERGRELPEEVIQLLAERIDTNVRELEGAVTKLLGFASLSNQEVTPGLVRECLRDLFVTRRGQASMEDVLRSVTEHFGVKLSDLQSKKRTNAIAFPRQVGMYLARKITRMSLEEIGGYFGGRDHTTVLYGVQKIKRLKGEDETVRKHVDSLLLDLQDPSAS